MLRTKCKVPISITNFIGYVYGKVFGFDAAIESYLSSFGAVPFHFSCSPLSIWKRTCSQQMRTIKDPIISSNIGSRHSQKGKFKRERETEERVKKEWRVWKERINTGSSIINTGFSRQNMKIIKHQMRVCTELLTRFSMDFFLFLCKTGSQISSAQLFVVGWFPYRFVWSQDIS